MRLTLVDDDPSRRKHCYLTRVTRSQIQPVALEVDVSIEVAVYTVVIDSIRLLQDSPAPAMYAQCMVWTDKVEMQELVDSDRSRLGTALSVDS